MRIAGRVALAFWITLGASAASGQYLNEIELLGQPLQYLKEGKVDGCGVRIIGVRPMAPPTTIQILDASFNVFAPGVGSVKGVLKEGPRTGVKPADLPRKPLALIWLRAPSGDATAPTDGQYRESPSDKDALIYFTESVDPILALFRAAGEKIAIQVGIRPKGAHMDNVLFGVIKLTVAELQQLSNCLIELERNLK